MCAAAGDAVWIGLNDRQVEGLFDWTDHSTVRFTSWGYGNPQLKSDYEDCVFIRGEVKRRVPSSKYLTPSKKRALKSKCAQIQSLRIGISVLPGRHYYHLGPNVYYLVGHKRKKFLPSRTENMAPENWIWAHLLYSNPLHFID